MRVQLITDEVYRDGFVRYLSAQSGIEIVVDAPDVILDAIFLDRDKKLAVLAELAPSVPVLTNTLTMAATTVAQALGGSTTVLGMPIFPHHFEGQKTVEISLPLGATYSTEVATNFLSSLGKTGEQIGDCVAGIFARTLAMIVNEAAFAVQESVALPKDIDTAMKLGTNYPKGPLAWCDEIGAEAIVAVLDALAGEYGPERYRVAPLLRRHAEAGMKFIENN